MSILSFFGFGKKKSTWVEFPPDTTYAQANEQLAAKLDTKGEIEKAVFSILQWAQDRKAKHKSYMKVYDFGFDNYGVELSPVQEGIIARLEELHIKAKIKFDRSGRHYSCWLEVSW